MKKHIDLENKDYCNWIDFLKKSENWTRKEIEKYQLEQIKKVISCAYKNCKGYRNLYDKANIKPSMIRSLQDFQKVPFITKEMIRDNLESFSIDVPKRQYVTTGGSTGIPFGFYRTKISFSKELASKAYQYYRIGWKEGDKQMVFRGLPIPSSNHLQYYPRFNDLRCSSYHLTPQWMKLYYEEALKFRPQWIKCYPSSGYIFAKFLKETKRNFPPVKGVFCASENLYDFQKKLLIDVFKARAFSHYGHYEMAVLAGFCENEDTYHILPQYGYAELVDENNNIVTQLGKMGEIVGTSFIMDTTLFIRYKTRDFATLKGWKCLSCGRPYQIWDKIEGRLQEFIVTSTGRYISMTAMNMHSDIFDHIKQFQFYQDTKGEVVFRFIPKTSCKTSNIQHIKKSLLFKMGDDVKLTMCPVKKISLTPRGKFRFLIQKMKIKYGDK